MSGGREIAVIIPVRDGLPELLDAIASALAQSPPPSELIVVDDASRDGSGDAAERRFGARVRVLRGTFGSAGAARNAGCREARSPWLAFLDADDLWLPGKLAAAGSRLDAVPEADWFFSDGAFRDSDGQLHASWLALWTELTEPWVGAPLAELFEINFVLTSSVVVRRAAFEAAGGFDERLTHAEDLDLWIRLARQGLATATRRALVRYQHRPGGLTRQAERRLAGNRSVFERLAADPTLATPLRQLARRRAEQGALKLALLALREGRRAEARGHLAHAWSFPRRAAPVALGWLASWLPQAVYQRLRGRGLLIAAAAPVLAAPRVALRGDARQGAPVAAGAALEGRS